MANHFHFSKRVEFSETDMAGIVHFSNFFRYMEMAEHAYFLQYLIYTVALHNYLKGCMRGYDYEKHMGGIRYIFLRGVERSTQRGVFKDRPAKELVEELSRVLGDFR